MHRPPSLAALKAIATPTRLPADLLGQRAYIEAARQRVEAAGYDVKNARAQFYPNINLLAFAGVSSIGLGRLLESGSAQWGVGPAIRLPIFEGGKLRANLRGKAADLDAAVESYNGAVLDAIHDAADQIASSRSITRQQAAPRCEEVGRERLRHRASTLQGGPGHLPEGAHGGERGADPATPRGRPGRARARKPGGPVRAFGGGYSAGATATTALELIFRGRTT